MQDKVRACTTAREFAALAQTEGLELTDEQLDAVAGGISWSLPQGCGSDSCGMFN